MPRLCDIVKRGVPCKVVSDNTGFMAKWDGQELKYHDGVSCVATSFATLLYDDWQLAEPTVDDVLKERGYRDAGLGQFSCVTGANQNYPSVTVPKITSPDEARRICDFLDTLKGTK